MQSYVERAVRTWMHGPAPDSRKPPVPISRYANDEYLRDINRKWLALERLQKEMEKASTDLADAWENWKRLAG